MTPEEIVKKVYHPFGYKVAMINLAYRRNRVEKLKAQRALHGRNHRNLKLKSDGSHTTSEWIELKNLYNLTCPACGKNEPQIKLTEDHIIPLSKGGTDFIENIQPLCKSCNSSKNTKTIKFEMVLCG